MTQMPHLLALWEKIQSQSMRCGQTGHHRVDTAAPHIRVGGCVRWQQLLAWTAARLQEIWTSCRPQKSKRDLTVCFCDGLSMPLCRLLRNRNRHAAHNITRSSLYWSQMLSIRQVCRTAVRSYQRFLTAYSHSLRSWQKVGITRVLCGAKVGGSLL